MYLLRYYLVKNKLINIFILICFQRFLHSFLQNINCVSKTESIYVLLVAGWKTMLTNY